MMIIVNLTGDLSFITGSVNGQAFSVSFDETKYQQMLDLQRKADAVQTVEELKAVIQEFLPLTQESYKELVETKSPYLYVNKHTNKFYLKYNDKVSAQSIPSILVDKMLKSVEKGIDITPLVKNWVRFLRNPKIRRGGPVAERFAKKYADYISATYTNDQKVAEFTSKEGLSQYVARSMATTTQVAITQEGLLVCYKVSQEITKQFVKDDTVDGGVKQKDRYDYDVDEFTGMKKYKEPEHAEDRVYEPAVMGQGGDPFSYPDASGKPTARVIQVGKLCELASWDQVNTDDEQSCVRGLHCGGLRYIQGYQNQGTVTHNIFVDPMDIGAIVGLGYGNDGAMRVLRYFVHSTFGGVNRSIYHSSEYGKYTDAQYAKMVEEAVKETQAKAAELTSILDETQALSASNATDAGVPSTAGTLFGS